MNEQVKPQMVIIVGLSGAGRKTALNSFEDIGYHRIENLPTYLLPRFMGVPWEGGPIVLGLEPRGAKDVDELVDTISYLRREIRLELIFLTASTATILRRYSETRRPHPRALDEPIEAAVTRERKDMRPLKIEADRVIDTTQFTPHELRAALKRDYDTDNRESGLQITVESFAYKRGLPRTADMVFDARFLRNPHWDENLRAKTGQNADVVSYIQQDESYSAYIDGIQNILTVALPAVKKENRSYFTICVGCNGGQHRSVAIAEALTAFLRAKSWDVTLRHRELEARGLVENPVGT